jgi:hypothetical protein
MFNLDCLQAALRPDERLEVHVRQASRPARKPGSLPPAPILARPENFVHVEVFAVAGAGARRTLISTSCPVAPEARP